jgi:hypothetical protein
MRWRSRVDADRFAGATAWARSTVIELTAPAVEERIPARRCGASSGHLPGAAGKHGTAPFVVYLVWPLGTQHRIGHALSSAFHL